MTGEHPRPRQEDCVPLHPLLMHTACGGQKEGEDLGTPQTPAGGLRPPAPPAEEVQNTLSTSLGNVDIRMHGHYTRGAQS
ncbi:MAG: hypothetical protein ACJ8DI_13980 [Ktedonobacteraceae bacterium]